MAAFRTVSSLLLLLVLWAGCATPGNVRLPVSEMYAETRLSPQEAYYAARDNFRSEGYDLYLQDERTGQLETEWTELSQGNVQVKIYADVARNGTVRYEGYYREGRRGDEHVIERTDEEGAPGYIAWQGFRNLVLNMPGTFREETGVRR